MDINQVFGGDSLKAADLNGAEPVVTIASVTMKKFDNGNKLVIGFAGAKKTLVCNKTNAQRIAFSLGPNTDLWPGQRIQLYTDLVQYQGSMVAAIRVRPAPKQPGQPPVVQPAPQPVFTEVEPPPVGLSGATFSDDIPF